MWKKNKSRVFENEPLTKEIKKLTDEKF